MRRPVGLPQGALGGAAGDEREREAHPRLGLPLRAAAPAGADRLLEVAYGRVGVVELERGHAERAVRRGHGRRVGAVAGAPQRLAGERARQLGVVDHDAIRLGGERGGSSRGVRWSLRQSGSHGVASARGWPGASRRQRRLTLPGGMRSAMNLPRASAATVVT